MTAHYPLPTPSRRVALGLIQAVILAAGPLALILFRTSICLTWLDFFATFALLIAAFAPMTLTATWRGPSPMARVLKFSMFAFFFAVLVILALAGPDDICTTTPTAIAAAGWVAGAGILLWAGLTLLGPKGRATSP